MSDTKYKPGQKITAEQFADPEFGKAVTEYLKQPGAVIIIDMSNLATQTEPSEGLQKIAEQLAKKLGLDDQRTPAHIFFSTNKPEDLDPALKARLTGCSKVTGAYGHRRGNTNYKN